MSYDASDLLLDVTDGNGKILEAHTFDTSRRGLTSVRANGVDSVKVQYTAQGQAQVISSQNIATTYGSAAFGGRGSVTNVNGPGCSSCGGRGNSTFFYDGSGNRTSSTDALGRTTTTSYDANGNVLSSSTPVGSSTITSSYTYNSFSEVLTATDPNWGLPTGGSFTLQGLPAIIERILTRGPVSCAKTVPILSVGDSIEREADSPSCCKR
jgi:YD repeat-containing protein